MKKLSDRTKRLLTIIGISVVCVAVIIGISYQLKVKGVNDTDASSSSSSSEVTVSAIGTDMESTAPAPSTTSQAPETSSKADQVIQPDVSKPAAPSSQPAPQGSTINPSKAPSYNQQDTTPSKVSEPKDGEKKDGNIYISGFGWIPDQGGGGSESTASDMYENGNKVGQMD